MIKPCRMVVGLQWIPNKKNKSVVVWVGNHPLLVLLKKSWPTPKWREETNYIEMVWDDHPHNSAMLTWHRFPNDAGLILDFITVYQASRVASDRQWLASAGSRAHAAKSSSSMARYEQLANYDMGLVPETVGRTENPNIPWFITILSAEIWRFLVRYSPLSIVERIDVKIWQLVFGRSEMFVATSCLTIFNLYISKGNFDMCWPDLDQQSCHPLGWRDTESTRVKPGNSCSICWTWEKAVCTGRDSYHWWLMLDKWSCSSDVQATALGLQRLAVQAGLIQDVSWFHLWEWHRMAT